jgi:retinol-binding protein 3
MRIVFASFVVSAAASLASAQPVQSSPVGADSPVDTATKHQVLEACADALRRAYIFEDVAAKMTEVLRDRESSGAYTDVATSREFARRVTDDLQGVSHDRHLRLTYSPEAVPARDAAAAPSPEMLARRERFERQTNYGFERVERLDGNVGYLEMRMFVGMSKRAEEVASAAMVFLADTDALIIDMRRNNGGNPGMIAYVSSYLFDERTHLNDLYWREPNRTEEFWTRTDVPGRKFGGTKPVFVLTSRKSFSGAEEFAYNLKALKRATIVGETTGGGAHPGGPERVGEHFALWLPRGRAINPITKTNWEGQGVAPDVAVGADEALDKARELARSSLHRPG